MTLDIVLSASPDTNLVVKASAGSGKTWLLVNRIIRLLWEGVPPSGILAITFTRKAAAEIDQRVTDQLFELTQCDEQHLVARMAQLGIPATPKHLHRARGLYESLLATEQGLRATTFHAFCGDILRRFPLEAEITPGFELLEDTADLEASAWQALEREAMHNPTGDLAMALDQLLKTGKGVYNLRIALNTFLMHRSDWWAFTETATQPIPYAQTALQSALGITPEENPIQTFLEAQQLLKSLVEYSQLLARHPLKTHLAQIDSLQTACDASQTETVRYQALCQVFLTKKGQATLFKPSKTLEAKLGATGMARLETLHAEISGQLLSTREKALRLASYQLSCAWYVCGHHLLTHFQALKRHQGLLDFADLEWAAYRLLNRNQHAEWVQYKLDQRIDHLLVDEFQDTNPTQWRLLLPLLQEIAAGDPERRRSVFLVGDEKQSIYRFRRADARLFTAAHAWLSETLNARTLTQDISWRSSPAITNFVNIIFQSSTDNATEDAKPSTDLLPNFQAHSTALHDRWGLVEVLPLIRATRSTAEPTQAQLRNPLEAPRQVEEDERYQREGELIAQKINSLIGLPIGAPATPRALHYGDIIILLRDRKHVQSYEQALRSAGIPYVGAGRGTLLECLEIRDMMHLLQVLISPYDNLALASILRSPLFACSDAHLLQLASEAQQGAWLLHLTELAPSLAQDHPLARAARLLQSWRAAADRVPVHDLLDRIYNEGNALARYRSTAPNHLVTRIHANLNRFLELALDVDSGRYPSLSRFHGRLRALSQRTQDAPSEPPSGDGERVRIMTIHAVKGLESPVVFLADAARDPRRDQGLRALIHWPVEAARPEYFYLVTKKDEHDDKSRTLLAMQETIQAREDANLLYVALTRARQLLFISGCETRRGGRGWYGIIERSLQTATPQAGLDVEQLTDPEDDSVINVYGRLQLGKPDDLKLPPQPSQTVWQKPDPALSRPLPLDNARQAASETMAPSSFMAQEQDPSPDTTGARERGIVIHRFLEQLSEGADSTALQARLRREMAGMLPEEDFTRCWQEANHVFSHPDFQPWFNSKFYLAAYNEMPLLYRHKEQDIYGIIDRLVITEQEAILIDYKTHAQATAANLADLASAYQEQLRLYALGLRKLWPDKKLRAWLLFTACRQAFEIDVGVVE